jgi:hypothetical protein
VLLFPVDLAPILAIFPNPALQSRFSSMSNSQLSWLTRDKDQKGTKAEELDKVVVVVQCLTNLVSFFRAISSTLNRNLELPNDLPSNEVFFLLIRSQAQLLVQLVDVLRLFESSWKQLQGLHDDLYVLLEQVLVCIHGLVSLVLDAQRQQSSIDLTWLRAGLKPTLQTTRSLISKDSMSQIVVQWILDVLANEVL